MRLSRTLFAAVLLALCGTGLVLCADEEAVDTQGRKVRGTLTIEGGTLRFVPAGQDKPLPVDGVAGIRFGAADAITPCAGNSVRALLADGQHLTGELLKLDGEQVQLRPAWAERVDLTRAAVMGLTQPPGYRTLFADALAPPATAWHRKGDALTYALPAPPAAGRLGATFQEKDKPGTQICQLEAEFQSTAGTRTVKITVAGSGDTWAVAVPDLMGTTRDVKRTPGPHRLAVQFTRESLHITCDNDVLWYNVEQGPGGPLKQVRLRGTGWSAFYLAQAVADRRHPPGDTEQDEVWLASDDQLFGTIVRADARTIDLEGRFGKRSLPWAEVRGLYLRRLKPADMPDRANVVRVWLRTGVGNETDVLDGVLLKIDAERFTLKHADLGELRWIANTCASYGRA